MVMKDNQRKAMFAKMKGGSRTNISPQMIRTDNAIRDIRNKIRIQGGVSPMNLVDILQKNKVTTPRPINTVLSATIPESKRFIQGAFRRLKKK